MDFRFYRTLGVRARITGLRSWLVSRVSRVTSSGEYLPEIDGLRFVAIITVIAHHAMARYLTVTARFGKVELPRDWYDLGRQDRLIKLISHFNFGVSLFFVISGFILALPFARQHLHKGAEVRLRRYYLRRLTRLEPPYFINLLICFALIVLPHPHAVTDYVRAYFPHLLASIPYLHGAIFGDASWINGVAWSLEVEVQFYLLVPLLAQVFRVRNAALRRALLAVSILVFAIVSQEFIEYSRHMRLRVSLVNSIAYFLAGFLLADLYLERWQSRVAGKAAWDGVAAASGALIVLILLRYSKAAFLLPFLVVAAYAAVFTGPVSRAVTRWKPLALTGGMCYSIYLYHFLIIDWVLPLTKTWTSLDRPLWLDFGIQFAIMCAVILPICAVLFVIAEKPFMKSAAALKAVAGASS